MEKGCIAAEEKLSQIKSKNDFEEEKVLAKK